MAVAFSSALAPSTGPSAVGGLAGGNNQSRSTFAGGRVRHAKCKFTIPATGAGSASGDVVYLWQFGPFTDISFIQVFHTALGAGVTLSIGKVDTNNSVNTDAVHYASAVDVSLAGNFTAGSMNMDEEAGKDPAGDNSVGNLAPGYGNGFIYLTATITGTPTAAATLMAIVFFSPGA